MTTRGWLGAALLVFSFGCGGSVTVSEAGDGSGGGESGGGGAGGGGAGGGNACSSYDDEASDTAVTLRFVNQTDRTIYLLSTCDAEPYEIAPQGGSPADLRYGNPYPCAWTCEVLQSGPGPECGPCQLGSFQLPIGSTVDRTWSGTRMREVLMEPACWFDGSGGTCSRIEAAPAGTYGVVATAYDDCGDGDCACGTNGWCEGAPSGASALANATIDFPTKKLVEVVFDQCAFGCP